MTPRNKLFYYLSIFFFFFLCLTFLSSAHAEEKVRVLVSDKQKNLNITVKGDYAVRALPSLQLLKTGKNISALVVAPTPRGIKVGSQEWAVQGIRVEPTEDRDLYLNKSRFRGRVDILKDKAGLLYAINTLGMDGYLYGVLHHEVAAWWPMAALRAQAIASRTYALYQTKVSKNAAYDLKSSTSSQVYGGSTTERYRSMRAIDQTHGEVLEFQGKVFPAYFHATCGGKTAAASELWKIDLPPLGGGVVCGFCKMSPHFHWEADVPLLDIEERMNKNGRPVGQVLDVKVISQTPSGRVGSLRITGTQQETTMAAKDFRIWIGGDRMRSTNFQVKIREDVVRFEGKGWGHGVGLCQWGTLGQALLGGTHEEILQFYYPKAQIVNYETK